MDLEKILSDINKFVVSKGDFILRNWSKMHVDLHEDQIDVSTNFDRQLEYEFYQYAKKKYPEFGFCGEELEEYKDWKEYTWVIDPIDGTKYFAKNIPLWSSTVALVKDGEPVLGCVYIPVSKQLFYAFKEGGAYLNKQKLKKIDCNLDDTTKQIISLEVTPELVKDPIHRTQVSKLVQHFSDKYYRVRMLGLAPLSLVWLASGYFDLFIDVYRPKDKYVDLAAGLCIVRECGAKIVRIEINDEYEQFLVGCEGSIENLKSIIRIS